MNPGPRTTLRGPDAVFLDRLAAATWLIGLPDNEREAVTERVILERTWRDAAAHMGYSHVWVEQLVWRALERLRNSAERQAA